MFSYQPGGGGGVENLLHNLLGGVDLLLQNVIEGGSKNGQNCVT